MIPRGVSGDTRWRVMVCLWRVPAGGCAGFACGTCRNGVLMGVGRNIRGPDCVRRARPGWRRGRRGLQRRWQWWDLPLRRSDEGFGRLLQAIVGQQVSVASAAAIWARLRRARMTTPAPSSSRGWRSVGRWLSRQKARYAMALAAAEVDYAALRAMPDAEVVRVLTGVPGIGVWTAEIYAMFQPGAGRCLCGGDLALQEGRGRCLCWTRGQRNGRCGVWPRRGHRGGLSRHGSCGAGYKVQKAREGVLETVACGCGPGSCVVVCGCGIAGLDRECGCGMCRRTLPLCCPRVWRRWRRRGTGRPDILERDLREAMGASRLAAAMAADRAAAGRGPALCSGAFGFDEEWFDLMAGCWVTIAPLAVVAGTRREMGSGPGALPYWSSGWCVRACWRMTRVRGCGRGRSAS